MKEKKIEDRIRDEIRLRHYSIRTEEVYVNWYKRYVKHFSLKHPLELGEKDIRDFLTFLAVEKNVSASTQNQAFNALLFLYKQVLHRELKLEGESTRAKSSVRLPVVLTRSEVKKIITALDDKPRMIVSLLYGTGMRCLSAKMSRPLIMRL